MSLALIEDAANTTEGGLQQVLEALQPRHALSPFYTLASSAALFPQFAAVAAGLRPGMDCWVPIRSFDAFRRFIEKSGLALTADCAFRPLPREARDRIIGVETLCTTHALGVRIEDAVEGDTVHAFVGATKEIAEALRACGWYPVVAQDRLFHKPFVDHLEFGRLLGYPDCCIAFFAASNDWNRTNSYAEAYLATKGACDHRTNCFGKNRGYSLNFHIPCRYDCRRTIEFSARLLRYLDETEPEYAAACRILLRKPVLSLNEREIIVLDGERLGDKGLRYRGAIDLFSAPAHLMTALGQGDRLELRGRFVAILRGSQLIETVECRCDAFGPQIPLLLSWV
jgi:hypothetical protein